jgi:hypothetical protein
MDNAGGHGTKEDVEFYVSDLCIGAIDDVGDGAMDIASIIAAVEQRGSCAYRE